jgi:hypothetical protein
MPPVISYDPTTDNHLQSIKDNLEGIRRDLGQWGSIQSSINPNFQLSVIENCLWAMKWMLAIIVVLLACHVVHHW